MPDARECEAMKSDECVRLYRQFIDSGLTPDKAAELVDDIAYRLVPEQRRELAKKLAEQLRVWADTLDKPDLSTKSAQAISTRCLL